MRRIVRAAGVMVATFTLLLGMGSAVVAKPVGPTGTQSTAYHFKNLNSDKCLSVPGASSNFAYLNQFHCGLYVDQLWTMTWEKYEAGYAVYSIRNNHSGKCLSVDSAGTADFSRVTQYQCGLYKDQYWYFRYAPGNQVNWMVNLNSQKCLAILDGSMADAAQAIIYECGSQRDHYWWMLA